jgi:hypothetical protein
MFARRNRFDARARTRRTVRGVLVASLGLAATVLLADARPAGSEPVPRHDTVQVQGTVLDKFDALAFDRGDQLVTTVYYVRFRFETPDGQARLNVCTVSDDVYARLSEEQTVPVRFAEGRPEQSCVAA